MNDNLTDFSSSNESGESDKEQIKAIRINAQFWLANKSMIYDEVSKIKVFTH